MSEFLNYYIPWFSTKKKERNKMNQTVFFDQKDACCSNVVSKCNSELSATTPERGCCSISIDSIREKAYLLWEEAGRPQCDGTDFWIEAEKQLKN